MAQMRHRDYDGHWIGLMRDRLRWPLVMTDRWGLRESAERHNGLEAWRGVRSGKERWRLATQRDKNNIVFLVSAKSRKYLSEWFSPCENLGVAAEHGYFISEMHNGKPVFLQHIVAGNKLQSLL